VTGFLITLALILTSAAAAWVGFRTGLATGRREGRAALAAEWRKPPWIYTARYGGAEASDTVPAEVVAEAVAILDAIPDKLAAPVNVRLKHTSDETDRARSSVWFDAVYHTGRVTVTGANVGSTDESWRALLGDVTIDWRGPDNPARRACDRALSVYRAEIRTELLRGFPRRTA
jgi:hypothetical protein